LLLGALEVIRGKQVWRESGTAGEFATPRGAVVACVVGYFLCVWAAFASVGLPLAVRTGSTKESKLWESGIYRPDFLSFGHRGIIPKGKREGEDKGKGKGS